VTLPHAILVFGLTVLIFAPFSGWLKSNMLIAEPLLAILAGSIFGLAVPLWIGDTSVQDSARELALTIARVTVAIQVTNSGLKVRKAFYRKHAWSLSMFLTIIMVLMWLASAAFVLACFAPRRAVGGAFRGDACAHRTCAGLVHRALARVRSARA
jgi:NhaP-type Na+/H+ or K+/H+ antiporter